MKIHGIVGLIVVLAVMGGCGDLPFLKSKKEAVAVGGVYDVRGTNPGGRGNYSGTAMISQVGGDVYKIDWSVGSAYSGTGRLSGKTLDVEWGDGQTSIGTVKYNVEPDGRLTGVWYTKQDPNNLGSEILLPRR